MSRRTWRKPRFPHLPPLPSRSLIAFAGLALLLVAVCGGGIVFAYTIFESGGTESQSVSIIISATPPETPIPTGTAVAAAVIPQDTILYDITGQYAFPIAADPDLYAWTHFHWDQSNAIDLKARFGLDYDTYQRATHATIVAITNGTILDYSGNTGGQGYMLEGDDGLDYYYAHLSEKFVPGGIRVTVGQPIGRMGNTGNSAQYIERHLHMSIGPRGSLWNYPASVNAAEKIQSIFNLNWVERPSLDVPYDRVQGWPVVHPDLEILTYFSDSLAVGIPQASIEIGFRGTPPDGPLDIIATLSGEIVINRWTDLYGTRIQITNEASRTTAVVSGVDEWFVEDGDIVRKGQIVGRWYPTHSPRLNYMIFENDVNINPSDTLGSDSPMPLIVNQ